MTPNALLDSVNQLNDVLKSKLSTLYLPTTIGTSFSSADGNSDNNTATSLRQAVNKNKNLSAEVRQQALLIADLLESSLKRQSKIQQQQSQSQEQQQSPTTSSTGSLSSMMKKTASNNGNNGNDDDDNDSSNHHNSSIILPPVVHFDIAKILRLMNSLQKNEDNTPVLRVVEDQKKKNNNKNNNNTTENKKSDNSTAAAAKSSSSSLSLSQLNFLLKNYFPQMEEKIYQLKNSANQRTQRMLALKAKIEAEMRSDEEDAKRQEITNVFKTVEGLIAARTLKEAAAMYLMAESMINSISNQEMKKTIQSHFETKMLEYQMKIGAETLQAARNNSSNNNNNASAGDSNNQKNQNNKDDDDEGEESDIDINLDEVLEELD